MNRVLSYVPRVRFHGTVNIAASRSDVIYGVDNRSCWGSLDKVLREQLEANFCSGFVVGFWVRRYSLIMRLG